MNQGLKKFGLWFISNKSFWTLHWRYLRRSLFKRGGQGSPAVDSLQRANEFRMFLQQDQNVDQNDEQNDQNRRRSDGSLEAPISMIGESSFRTIFEQSWGSRVVFAHTSTGVGGLRRLWWSGTSMLTCGSVRADWRSCLCVGTIKVRHYVIVTQNFGASWPLGGLTGWAEGRGRFLESPFHSAQLRVLFGPGSRYREGVSPTFWKFSV